ncbi:hypothetical protein KHA73_05900 [Serratia entomophila]|nr:hypothetical protein KHA73_04930 [Serratia entomophila]UIW19483.1 hypothetical protein KHA73_05900 [Serratia entomophila]
MLRILQQRVPTGTGHKKPVTQFGVARQCRHVSGDEVRAMICADCGKELQDTEVYVCDSCDQEQRKFIDSVMGEDNDG